MHEHTIEPEEQTVADETTPRRTAHIQHPRGGFGKSSSLAMAAAAILAQSMTPAFEGSSIFDMPAREGKLHLPLRNSAGPYGSKKDRAADPNKKAARKAQAKARAKNRRK